jgi:hypothetical protein
VRRVLAVLWAVVVVLVVPSAAQADDVTFDNGYDPGSPAGKQYAIPSAGVVGATKVKPAPTAGPSSSADAGLFGAGVTAAASSSKQRRHHAARLGQSRHSSSPVASDLGQEIEHARSTARSAAGGGGTLTSVGLGIGGLVLLTGAALAIVRARRPG